MRGRDKLLEPVDGTPLLLRQVRMALSLYLPVLVTLAPATPKRALLFQNVSSPDLTVQHVADAKQGISASLRTGARWADANGFTGLMVILPDMPDLEAQDLAAVAHLQAEHPDDVIRATDASGQQGHPTVLPARLYPALMTLSGDRGARDVLRKERIRPCPLSGNRATTDLDTPEAWTAWRAARD